MRAALTPLPRRTQNVKLFRFDSKFTNEDYSENEKRFVTHIHRSKFREPEGLIEQFQSK